MTAYKYALIRPDEDGNPITYISPDDLEDINQLMEDYGVERWVEKYDDPMYWEEGDAMLLKVECYNPKPKLLVSSWSLPHDN